MQVTILGCGSSSGVPIIGCRCVVCRSSKVKNIRTRSSILITHNTYNILIDSSPDLRQQALTNNINKVDAILFTHAHADHTGGIDDLRSFNYLSNSALPIYADRQTLNVLQERFAYAFQAPALNSKWYRPYFTVNEITIGKTFRIGDLDILPFYQVHGQTYSIGFRFGEIAYSTDVNFLPEESIVTLRNLEVWIVDCLGYQKSLSHAYLPLILEWIKKIMPKRVILTHMGHDIDYDVLKKKLPNYIEPAYDGMKI